LESWEACATDTIRCLLGDEVSQVRTQAARLLAEIGDLRDIGLLDDLLALAPSADETADERPAFADAMEMLALRTRERRCALD
jgi:HEAT repeat protein